MRGYLRASSAAVDAPGLASVLWAAKRFVLLTLFLTPMTAVALVALAHCARLLSPDVSFSYARIGREFVIPWVIGLDLVTATLAFAFVAVTDAGILLKVHYLRTGRTAISFAEGKD